MSDPEVDLVERCAAAVWHEWTGRQWDDIDEVNRKLSRSVARRVLAEAERGAPEPAVSQCPIQNATPPLIEED